MIHINPTGVFLSVISFSIVILLLFLYDKKNSKYKASELDKRLNHVDESTNEEPEIKEKKEKYKDLSLFQKLQYNLDEGEVTMKLTTFIGIFAIASMFLYLLTLSIFKQPLVAFSPLPFTLFFLPKMIIDSKKRKVMRKFNEELVIVLRRMSSVLQTGSVYQALIETRSIPSLSKKMKKMLSEVEHRYKYGDDIVDAFYKASENIKSENLNIAIVSLDLNKELGADLATSLSEIAMRIQDKQLAAREAESLMSSTLVIGQILSIAPFLIIGYLSYTNPSYFSDYLINLGNQLLFMVMVGVMFFGIYIVNTKTKVN